MTNYERLTTEQLRGALNERELLVVDLYLKYQNMSRVAREIGYAHPPAAWSAFKRPHVKAYYNRLLDEISLTANEVIDGLTRQARGSAEMYLSFDDDGTPYVDLQRMQEEGNLGLIKKIRRHPRSGEMELELYDKQQALVTLGRYHKLFTDRVEHEGNLVLTPEEARDSILDKFEQMRPAANGVDVNDSSDI